MSSAKDVAQDLLGQLSQAKQKKVRKKRKAVHKLCVEFQDIKNSDIYSYALFQKGKEFRNLSSVCLEGVGEVQHIDKTQLEIVEDVLNKLKDDNFKLVDFDGMFDVETTDKFNEDDLRFFVKQMKEQIIEKIRNEKENEQEELEEST